MEQNSLHIPPLPEAQKWNLYLRVSPSGFDALLYSRELPEPMRGVSRSVTGQPDLLPALETFVYDNPILLNDFGKVTVLIDTQQYTLLPTEIEDEETVEQLFTESLPETANNTDRELLADHPAGTSLNIVFQPGDKLLTFLRRTFHNIRIVHALHPLIGYFSLRRHQGNHARTYVNVAPDKINVIIFRESGVAFCNGFSYSTVDDAVYYILASRQLAGDLDADNDEIYICGATRQRQAIAQRLGEFVRNILPVIFPPALFRKAGNVMELPFELILMPLCE